MDPIRTMNRSFLNNTDSSKPTELPRWTIWTILTIAIFFIAILSNFIILLQFLIDHSLCAPFGIYIINLLAANIVRLLIQYPFNVLMQLYPTYIWYMDPDLCGLLLYANYVLGTGVVNIHAVIAVNRTWAIVRPLSYRAVHSVRFASLCCLGLWIYMHVICGAQVVIERNKFALRDGKPSCTRNQQGIPTWNVVTTFIGIVLPLAIILLSFPVLVLNLVLRKKGRRFRRVWQQFSSHTNDVAMQPSCPETNLDSDGSKKKEELRGNGKGHGGSSRGSQEAISQKYLILALLTVSVVICYVPAYAYQVWTIFVPSFWNSVLFRVSSVLFQCQAVLDSVLFAFTLKDLRASLWRTYTIQCWL